MERIVAVYRVRSDAASIEARAQAIALEQSVELPREAIISEAVLRDIVGEVRAIREVGAGLYEVRIGLAATSAGCDAGQLLNILFGNTSLQEDVTLQDAEFPEAMAAQFGGPNYGIRGLRKICGAGDRAADLRRGEAAGPAAEGAGRAGGEACSGRHRFHQGRSRPCRPDLQPLRRARPGLRGCGLPCQRRHGAADLLCAQHLRRSRTLPPRRSSSPWKRASKR